MKVTQSVVFSCVGCSETAHCGPHTRHSAYKILAIYREQHKNCFDLLKRLRRQSSAALRDYNKKKLERPRMSYDIGWRYGYYRGYFSAFLIAKHKGKLKFFEKNLEVCLAKHLKRWKVNQITKKRREKSGSTEVDGNIDGIITALREAIQLQELSSPKPKKMRVTKSAINWNRLQASGLF